MKKIKTILFVSLMVLSMSTLAACGNSNTKDNNSANNGNGTTNGTNTENTCKTLSMPVQPNWRRQAAEKPTKAKKADDRNSNRFRLFSGCSSRSFSVFTYTINPDLRAMSICF